MNAKLGLDNFTATVRLSEPDQNGAKLPRWTPDFIESELSGYAGNLSKIWVCGPPAVNEMFDKTLGALTSKL